ncbi:MAG TPA: patatin-like protein [Anaerolineales bacterium]|nr:patatin-like protein [Anaerolineales bacterium]
MTIQPEKEVRFAVVMYGGVSLAIYINGVTQELMSMVRATARARGSAAGDYHLPNVKGVEEVYRRLGEHLQARFVVDILSGTSAGGINAVYLAKALANDQQIDQLKELWIKEGDIGLLINDKESLKNLDGLVVPDKPASLLNSQRMYCQLLIALQGMQKGSTSEADFSPYADELDLFITATDLQGLDLPVRASGGASPRERRFRNVFHFQYATSEAIGIDDLTRKEEPLNDFRKVNDPFLAFAARSTSSFPFAFEPIRLQDLKSLLQSGLFNDYSYQPQAWSRFYSDYEAEHFPDLAFGDGGYLDNKPFSYATAALNRRRADLPVDRKLVYIEPAPERIKEKQGKPEPPDAIANVLMALLTLPRYETIREDLQLVSERNGLIQNVRSVIQNIETVSQQVSLKPWEPSRNWREEYLDEQVKSYGPGYLIYHQLRVNEVLQNLSEMIVRGMGWKEDSPQAKDLYTLLQAWRRSYYKVSSKEPDSNRTKRKSENELLFRLDTTWRLRRLHYLRALIDALLKDLGSNNFAAPGSRSKSILDHSDGNWAVDEGNREHYRSALMWVKKKLNEAYVEFRGRNRAMRSRNLVAKDSSPDPNREAYKSALNGLKNLLETRSQDGTERLEELCRLSAAQAGNSAMKPEQEKSFHEALNRLEELSLVLSHQEAKPKQKGLVRAALSQLSDGVEAALNPPTKPGEENDLLKEVQSALESVRKCLMYYHEHFEYFDMLTYPVTYGTSVGESDEVEIIRISPEDADSLRPRSLSHTKLLGTKLGNFGAFFNAKWRENDMLWGRLDGAECLINAVWPKGEDDEMRKQFIREAHNAILDDFWLGSDKKVVHEALFGTSTLTPQQLQEATQRLTRDTTHLTDTFASDYLVDPNFPAEPTLKVIARSTRVLGKLMGGLSTRYPLLSEPAGISTRVGSLFFTFISFAISQSVPGLLFGRFISWIYLLELILVTLGIVFIELDTPNVGIDFTTLGTQMSRSGAMAILLTLLAHLSIITLGNVITRKWTWTKIGRAVLGVIIVVLVVALSVLIYFGFLYLGSLLSPE